MLLDNGRTRVLADEVGRQALHCIRCSACLNVCPVYSRTGGHAYGSVYPGPIGAILTPQLVGIENAPRCRSHRACAAPATRSARSRSTSRACCSTCARKAVEARRRGAERAAMRAGGVGVRRVARRFALAAAARPARAAAARAPRADPAAPRPALGLDERPRPQAARARELPRLVEARAADERRARRSWRGSAARSAAAPPARCRASTAGRAALDRRARVALFCERVGDYRAEVRRSPPTAWRRGRRGLPRARRSAGRSCPPGLPAEWRPRGVELVEDHGLDAAELDALDGVAHRLHRRDRRDRHDRPRRRPARGPARAHARPRPPHLRRRGRDRSSSSCPRRSRALGELVATRAPPAHVHLRPVGDVRHRAQPRRRRPRPAQARRPRSSEEEES